MSGYRKPKTHLHHEFLYLNYDTIINSLSALEAGKVDEIIEKFSEAREGGMDGTLGYGPAKLAGGKKKTATMEEELRRTRTWFSAFEAWFQHLDGAGAFGELTSWDLETRDEIGIGDTVKFIARVSLSPVQRVFLTFISFANESSNPDSPLKQPAAKMAETKRMARMVSGWMKGRSESKSLMVYMAPFGIDSPRIAARLDETYLIGGTQAVEGEFTIIAQVESLIQLGESVPAIRVVRDTPPTPLETETITASLQGMAEMASGLGVAVNDSDLTLQYPGVILHPIAIYR